MKIRHAALLILPTLVSTAAVADNTNIYCGSKASEYSVNSANVSLIVIDGKPKEILFGSPVVSGDAVDRSNQYSLKNEAYGYSATPTSESASLALAKFIFGKCVNEKSSVQVQSGQASSSSINCLCESE